MIQGGLSGVGRYVIALAGALVERGIDLHVAGLEADRRHFPRIGESNWVTIPDSASSGLKNLIWHQLKLPGILKKGGYDLVHIPSYRRMIIRSPVPQIATIHDCAPFVLAHKYDFFRGLFGRRLVPWMARRMDRVIAVSQTTAADIEKYLRVDSGRVQVVHNGIDHRHFKPAEAVALEAFRLRHHLDKPYLVYIARFEHPAKNHVRLIQAFSQWRKETGWDWQLVLGGAPWHGSEVIDAAIERSPVRDEIRLPGFIDDAELPLWYAASKALVFPSLMEGFGFPVIEAQACGALVLTSDSTSLKEVRGPASLCSDPMSEASMAEALKSLSGLSEAERAERIATGLEWASQFSWEHAAEAMETHYREVLHG